MVSVSVVIPTYKRNDFLDRAIQSVLNQTYKDFEIVVVDDNTPDSTYRKKNVELEKKYVNFPVRFVYNEKNLGGSGARNRGIREASGDYIAFLDDDDTFTSNKLMIMIGELRKSNEHMAYSYVKSDKDVKYQNFYSGNAMYELFRDDCLAATSQWIITKEALDSVGGFDITPAKQDSILTFKLLNKGYKVICVPKFLSVYYEHEGERISNSGKTLIGEMNLYKRYRDVKSMFSLGQRRSIEANFNFRIFKYKLKSKNYFKALFNFLKLIFLFPDHLSKFIMERVLSKNNRNMVRVAGR